MSTLVELAGFACIVIAATLTGGPAAGWAAAAVCLLVIGYSIEDRAVVMHVNRVVDPWRRRAARLRQLRRERRTKP